MALPDRCPVRSTEDECCIGPEGHDGPHLFLTAGAGSAARVRAWWLRFVAGETDAPAELVQHVQTVEGLLPIIRVLPGIRGAVGGARSIVDLLPDDDESMGVVLQVLHDWTGAMLQVPAQPEPPAAGTAAGGLTPDE